MKRIVLIALALGIGVWLALTFWRSSTATQPPETANQQSSADASGQAALNTSPESGPLQTAPASRDRSPRQTSVPGAKGPIPVLPATTTEQAQALVSKMTELALGRSALSQGEAALIHQQFAELKAQGALAIPAIREFLARNQDISFTVPPEAETTIGYGSLRLGFLDTLREIGGPEAVSAAADTLKNTGDPLEVATLAAILEKDAPGEHRVEVLKAAADSLALAASGQLTGQRVAPAFEVLQTYGDTNVIPVLREQMGHTWAQNAAIALAELPDGLGVAALVEMAQDPKVTADGNGDVALRPLAQVAVRYPQAFDALIAQAQQGKISDRAWPMVASAVAGNDYISNGNVLPETRPPGAELHALLPQRMALLDRLAAAGLSEMGLRAIQQQRGQLAARMVR